MYTVDHNNGRTADRGLYPELHRSQPNLLAAVIEVHLGVSLRVAVAHRLPLTGHFPSVPLRAAAGAAEAAVATRIFISAKLRSDTLAC